MMKFAQPAGSQAGECGGHSYILFHETQSKQQAACNLYPSGNVLGLVRNI